RARRRPTRGAPRTGALHRRALGAPGDRRDAAALRPVVFRRVDGLEADDRARVVEVAIAPAVARRGVEDVEAHDRRCREAPLDHARDVALAAVHGELARLPRPVLGAHAADADAEDREAVRVRVLTRERFAPDLARAI